MNIWQRIRRRHAGLVGERRELRLFVRNIGTPDEPQIIWRDVKGMTYGPLAVVYQKGANPFQVMHVASGKRVCGGWPNHKVAKLFIACLLESGLDWERLHICPRKEEEDEVKLWETTCRDRIANGNGVPTPLLAEISSREALLGLVG